ncbi:MAG: hypothetical protein D9V47_02575 [Clostridia bacterium]|nr:MAG: hypothetical protein D9V47_02575 [Clostridia bacterium]
MRQVNDRLSYLPDSDLSFLVQAVATQRTDHVHIKEIIRDKPDLIDIMLDDPQVVTKIKEKQEMLLQLSPYIFFTVLLRQVKRELRDSTFTLELLETAEEIPVFDSPEVVRLLENDLLLDYLAELLTTFTRTYGGAFYYRVGNRWYRRRFSDLDMDDLLSLLELLEPENRFPIYKRLGDLSLFLTGIFPAAVVRRPEIYASRHSHGHRLEEYLELGPQFYLKAAACPEAQREHIQGILQVLSSNFAMARKPLNVLAQKYMGSNRCRWFSLESGS